MDISEYTEKLFKCTNCGFCRISCPVGKYMNMEEKYSPRGRVKLTYATVTGLLKPSNRIAESLYTCSTCGYCQSKCLVGIEINDAIEAMRGYLVNQGFGRTEHMRIKESICTNGNPFFEKSSSRQFKGASEGRKVLYWVGCMTDYRVPEVGKSTLRILDKAGVNCTILENAGCCSSVLLRTGFIKEAVPIIKDNIAAIERTGAPLVITSCAECYRTLKKDYPKFANVRFEVLHISQFLEQLIKAGKHPSMSAELRVTYHDPCHLGHMKLYEAPRSVIKSIHGVSFVEMRNCREEARCCGYGGGLRSAFGPLSQNIAKDRLKDVPEGMDILLSACPFCYYHLKEASGGFLRIMDLVQLVDEALAS